MSQTTFATPTPEAILDQLGPIVRETVFVEERTYSVEFPGQADKLRKHPAVQAANAQDDYMPYWAELWPAARMLAKAIVHEPWPAGTEALEIGCGLGLPGIVALSMGVRVTFSDYDATALRFAAANARLNGYEDFRTMQLDWRSPPDDLRARVILASDLVYEHRNVEPVVVLINKILQPGGLCLLTDQERIPIHLFQDYLNQEGLAFTTKMMRAGEPGGNRVKGILYRITKPA